MTSHSKPCNPRVGQAEYERCLDEKREKRSGRGNSRLAEALDEVSENGELEIEDD